jgi:NADH:ubiquinone oxidoreductase subunit 6 (subunit J)
VTLRTTGSLQITGDSGKMMTSLLGFAAEQLGALTEASETIVTALEHLALVLREVEKSTPISPIDTFSWWFTGRNASPPRKTRLVAPCGLMAATSRGAQRWARQPAWRGRALPRVSVSQTPLVRQYAARQTTDNTCCPLPLRAFAFLANGSPLERRWKERRRQCGAPAMAAAAAPQEATVIIAHAAHAFPSRQVSVESGEQVEILERFDSGWWDIRKADGRVGRVPSNKLDERGAGQEQLRHSLSRSLSRRSITTPARRPGHGGRTPPALPALPEGRAGSPRRAGDGASFPQPPVGLTKMEQIKWKKEQHLKLQQAGAGYGGDPVPVPAVAPGDVQLQEQAAAAAAATAAAPSCLSHVGNVVGIELQRVAYSVWSKYLTAFTVLVVLLLSGMVLLMEAEEERHISSEVTRMDELDGTITSFHQLGALVSLVVALLLLLNERFWKLLPGRKDQKDGTLWVRLVLLVVLLVVQLVASPILLGFAVLLLPTCITIAGMRDGERDQPWPVQRGATKLERDDLAERQELRRLAREAGAASLCAEQVYRLKEEDKLGRYIILVVYVTLNVYMFFEAYARWVGIVESQGD